MEFEKALMKIKKYNIQSVSSEILISIGEVYLNDHPNYIPFIHSNQKYARELIDFADKNKNLDGGQYIKALLFTMMRLPNHHGDLFNMIENVFIKLLDDKVDYAIETEIIKIRSHQKIVQKYEVDFHTPMIIIQYFQLLQVLSKYNENSPEMVFFEMAQSENIQELMNFRAIDQN